MTLFSKATEISKNVGYGILGRVVSGILQLVLLKNLVVFFDILSFGIWATLTTVIVILSGIDFGVGSSIINLISKERDLTLHRSILKNEFRRVLFRATVLFLTLILLNRIVPFHSLFKGTGVNTLILENYFTLAIVASYLMVLSNVLPFYNVAMLRQKYNTYSSIGSAFVALISIMILKNYFNLDIFYALLAVTGSSIVMALINSLATWSRLPASTNEMNASAHPAVYQHNSFFVLHLITLLSYNIDILIISKYIGTIETGNYKFYQQFMNYCHIPFVYYLQTNWPLLNRITDADEKHSTFRGQMTFIKKLSFIVGMAFILFAGRVIYIYTDGKYGGDYILGGLFAIATYLFNIVGCYTSYFNGVGKLKLQIYIYSLAIAFNLLITALLIEPLGIYAPITGTIVGLLIVLYLYRPEIKKEMMNSL